MRERHSQSFSHRVGSPRRLLRAKGSPMHAVVIDVTFNDASAAQAELSQLVPQVSAAPGFVRWLLDRAVAQQGHIGRRVRLRGVGAGARQDGRGNAGCGRDDGQHPGRRGHGERLAGALRPRRLVNPFGSDTPPCGCPENISGQRARLVTARVSAGPPGLRDEERDQLPSVLSGIAFVGA